MTPPQPRIVHRDTQPPAFKALTTSATTLWPPNHRMVPVSLDAALVDLLDPAPTARIVGVSSNEPIDGDDDGNTSPDWEITGPLSVNLRAERSGTEQAVSTRSRSRAGTPPATPRCRPFRSAFPWTASHHTRSTRGDRSDTFRGTPGRRAGLCKSEQPGGHAETRVSNVCTYHSRRTIETCGCATYHACRERSETSLYSRDH